VYTNLTQTKKVIEMSKTFQECQEQYDNMLPEDEQYDEEIDEDNDYDYDYDIDDDMSDQCAFERS
jgi:hypothetical protein